MRTGSKFIILIVSVFWLTSAAAAPLILAFTETEYGPYAPAAPFFEAAGISYNWNQSTYRLSFESGDHTVSMTVSSLLVLVDDQIVELDQPLRFIKGVLSLPDSFFTLIAQKELGLTIKRGRGQAESRTGSRETPKPYAIRRVAIDPGHGGKDTGAVSASGASEKDIVLSIALRLADILENEIGIQAVLTRKADVFVPLSARAKIANEAQADVFISLHVNAHRNSQFSGIETYYLNFDPSDEDARAMALAENKSVDYENDDSPAGADLDDLKLILWDLVKTEHQQESSLLAEIVQEHLCQTLDFRNRGVRQAPLFVMMGADMPSILVEVGFLSNQKEAAVLVGLTAQEKIARALLDSLLQYDKHLAQELGLHSPGWMGKGVQTK